MAKKKINTTTAVSNIYTHHARKVLISYETLRSILAEEFFLYGEYRSITNEALMAEPFIDQSRECN